MGGLDVGLLFGVSRESQQAHPTLMRSSLGVLSGASPLGWVAAVGLLIYLAARRWDGNDETTSDAWCKIKADIT